jgi:hypothetical protein
MRCQRKSLYVLGFLILAVLISFFQQSVGAANAAQLELILTVQTDKIVYLPGDMVKISGIVKDSGGEPIANATISIEVRDPGNSTVFLDIIFSLANGTYQDSFRLHSNAPFGDYPVFVTATTTGYPTAYNQTTFTVGIHDVAAIKITLDPTPPRPGIPLHFNVTVENQGNFTENFNVSLYYTRITDPIIGRQTITLFSQTSATLTFEWTTDITGRYEIRAEASIVPKELETADNIHIINIQIYPQTSGVSNQSNSASFDFAKVLGMCAFYLFSIFLIAPEFKKNRSHSDTIAPFHQHKVEGNIVYTPQDWIRRQFI